MVDRWCSDEWMVEHLDRQKRRGKMIGKAHHQGNVNLLSYRKAVAKRTGEPCSQYQAFALSYIAKASVVMPYSASIRAESHTSRTSSDRMTKYDEAFKEKHGPDSDPSAHDLDPEVVGGGRRQHSRLSMGGSIISTASTPTLPQIKARQTSSSPVIRYRSTPIELEIEARIVEERRANDEKWFARIVEERRANDEKWEAMIVEERRSNEERIHKIMAAYMTNQVVPTSERPTTSTPNTPHPSVIGSNEPGSTHAGRDNPLGDSPHF